MSRNGSGEWKSPPNKKPAKTGGSVASGAFLALLSVAAFGYGFKHTNNEYHKAHDAIAAERPGYDTFTGSVGNLCLEALEEDLEKDTELTLDTSEKLARVMDKHTLVCRVPLSVPLGVLDDAAEYYTTLDIYEDDASDYAFWRALMVFAGVLVTPALATAGYQSGKSSR